MPMTIGPMQGRLCEFKGKTYLRFGPGDWYEQMGSAFEPVYDDEDLETAYAAAQRLRSGD